MDLAILSPALAAEVLDDRLSMAYFQWSVLANYRQPERDLPRMVNPADIVDPQFEVLRVLYSHNGFSIVAGRWEGGGVSLGERWDGEEGRLGYPVGRHRQPKFLVLHDDLTRPTLGMLATANLEGTDLAAVTATLAEI